MERPHCSQALIATWRQLAPASQNITAAVPTITSAVLKSVGKVDPLLSSNHLFNQRFAPQFLDGENREIFADYLKTWSDLGIHHIQFNVIDPDLLKDAQKNPEKSHVKTLKLDGDTSFGQ